MRIGVFGGSFDPPHNGHIALASAAAAHLGLEEVMFLPNARNPLKADPSRASSNQRLEMVKRLIEDQDHFSLCDLEVRKGGRSYTVEAMTELKFAQEADYWFLCGTDVLFELEEWRQPRRLLRLCRLAVALRPPHTPDDILAKTPEFARESVDFVPMEPMPISSHDIRERLGDKRPVEKYFQPSVLAYIKSNSLYNAS